MLSFFQSCCQNLSAKEPEPEKEVPKAQKERSGTFMAENKTGSATRDRANSSYMMIIVSNDQEAPSDSQKEIQMTPEFGSPDRFEEKREDHHDPGTSPFKTSKSIFPW